MAANLTPERRPDSDLGSNVKPRKSSVLECRVCDNVFGVQGDKIPRLLFCGHTFCHSCLSRLPQSIPNLIETESGSEVSANIFIQCPFDRQPTTLGPNGVWDLKKNFALLELLERLEDAAKEKENRFTTTFLERERELSVCCDENEDHIAVVYCTTCATHLCEECSDTTHGTRTLAKHRRIPLSEKPREKPKCPNHTSHVTEFTCLEKECESSPLMCYICKDYGRHKGHSHNLLELEAEKWRCTVTQAMQHLKQFVDNVQETARSLERIQQEIIPTRSRPEQGQIGTAEKAKQRVRSYFQGLRDQLNRQEVAALTVVETYIRERLCFIRQHQEDIEIIANQVGIVCSNVSKAIKQDDARVILAVSEIKEMIETVETQQKQFSEVSNEQLIPDASIPITFTKDNRVHIGQKIEMRVVTLGLDSSGKTSILFKLKQNEFVQTIPTIGFNVETLEYKNIKFTVWDVGGQPKLRPLWKHYYLNTQAVVFVIDSSNRERLDEAQGELIKLITEKELKDACLLILLNKQDLEGCLTLEEITDKFSLYKLCCGRSWHIQACDAPDGTGLTDGLDWLSRQLVASGVHDLG